MRLFFATLLTGLAITCPAQTLVLGPAAQISAPSSGPDPQVAEAGRPFIGPLLPGAAAASLPNPGAFDSRSLVQDQTEASSGPSADPKAKPSKDPVDAQGKPIPLERRQPQRILGFMPNFRTVSGGAQAPPAGFRYNFVVATHQAFDYSSFFFLGLTSLTAEAMDEHTDLGEGMEGFGQYTWRGFLDKTDNTYLSAWILPTLLHEDTRYYALGNGHSIPIRALYVVSQQAVARTYGGARTPNIAGLGGKAITQYVSRYYYPPSAATFGVLAEKFGYSVMRDVMFCSLREFYPDVAAHYVRRHREKKARLAAEREGSKSPAH